MIKKFVLLGIIIINLVPSKSFADFTIYLINLTPNQDALVAGQVVVWLNIYIPEEQIEIQLGGLNTAQTRVVAYQQTYSIQEAVFQADFQTTVRTIEIWPEIETGYYDFAIIWNGNPADKPNYWQWAGGTTLILKSPPIAFAFNLKGKIWSLPLDEEVNLRAFIGEEIIDFQTRRTLPGEYDVRFNSHYGIKPHDSISIVSLEDKFEIEKITIGRSPVDEITREMVASQTAEVDIWLQEIPTVADDEFSLWLNLWQDGKEFWDQVSLEITVGKNTREFLVDEIYQIVFSPIADQPLGIKKGQQIEIMTREDNLIVLDVKPNTISKNMIINQEGELDVFLEYEAKKNFELELTAQVSSNSFWSEIEKISFDVTVGKNQKTIGFKRSKQKIREYHGLINFFSLHDDLEIRPKDLILIKPESEWLKAVKTEPNFLTTMMVRKSRAEIKIILDLTMPEHQEFIVQGAIWPLEKNTDGWCEINQDRQYFNTTGSYAVTFESVKHGDKITMKLAGLEIKNLSADTIGWTELLAGKITVNIEAETLPPDLPPLQEFRIKLYSGVNLISIPIKTNLTIKSLAELLGEANLIVYYDYEKKNFVACTSPFTSPNALKPIGCGVGYIVVMLQDKEIVFTGESCGITLAAPKQPQTALLQNYPNPFNPETSIPFRLAEGSDVIIQIHNIKGQLIKKIDFQKQNPGYHKIMINLADFASGIYFYTLQTKNFRATKKMLLVK